MSSDDSLNDSDEIFDLYSSKKVTETFKTHFEKLVSKGIFSGGGEHSEGVLNDVNNFNEKLDSPIEEIEDLELINYSKVRNIEDLIPSVSVSKELSSEDSIPSVIGSKELNSDDLIPSVIGSKELSSEDSIDSIEIIGEQPSGRRTRKSARLRSKRDEVCVLDDSVIILPEPAFRSRKRSSNSGRKIRNKKKKVIEEIDLDDSLDELEKLDEDELNPEVSVKVIWKSVSVKKFRIRKFQKMSKIYEEISREENIPEEKIFLTFNDAKVKRHDTPDSLNLQIYHFIDGGVLSKSTNTCEPSNTSIVLNDNNSISLKFQGVANKIVKIVLNKDQKMKIGMIKCAEQLEVPLGKMKFIFDGEQLDPSETPTSLGLEGDEIIDVKILH